MNGRGLSRGRKYGGVTMYRMSTSFGDTTRVFRSKNVPTLLMMVIFFVIVTVSLTQVLLVHDTRTYRTQPVGGHNPTRIMNIRTELRAMDRRLKELSKENVPSIELHRRRFQNNINSWRFAWLIGEAAKQNANNSKEDAGKRGNSTDGGFNNVSDFCPETPPDLKGTLFVDADHPHNYHLSDVIEQNPDVELGGIWRPPNCIARHRVAIIIPYRDRQEHLVQLLSHLHPILQRQQLDYRIFVSEQYSSNTFNKGILMNTAFTEALKLRNYDCFVFHDVDLVPEDDTNMYSCPTFPRHMSVAIDKHDYKLRYKELVGGVLNIPRDAFFAVNGYSNLYWGWGAEDDDMYYRMRNTGLRLMRPPDTVARYKMLKHTQRKASDWNKRKKLLHSEIRNKLYINDGLNSLKSQIVFIHPHPLYTHIMVDVGQKPAGF